MTEAVNLLKSRIQNDMKSFMREKKSKELAVIRLLLAEIKQIEVDKKTELNSDEEIVPVLDKMIKQRQQAISQFREAGRDDLVEQEQFEVNVLKNYLPAPLAPDEIQSLIEKAIQQTGALNMKDMGKVMSALKPNIQGRADMSKVTEQIKQRLSS